MPASTRCPRHRRKREEENNQAGVLIVLGAGLAALAYRTGRRRGEINLLVGLQRAMHIQRQLNKEQT
jgi:hypothetical protein